MLGSCVADFRLGGKVEGGADRKSFIWDQTSEVGHRGNQGFFLIGGEGRILCSSGVT